MNDFTFRPLGADWLHDGKESYECCRFRAPYSKTLNDLRYELGRFGVSEAVIELDLTDREIRRDGLPRSDARPQSPRVRLSFNHPALGSLQYPCDTYGDYRDNLRAIAKTLEAQRAMDRYGATRLNQQYAGWKALPSGRTIEQAMTVEAAAAFIVTLCGGATTLIISSASYYQHAYRRAAKATHPDTGGDESEFKRLQEAKRLLHQHHGLAA